jgi:LmbE family N-acetylglucosaminyl deacetylase
MRLLYIFPHPDDESFGPAPVIAKQRREGHEVFLLTLTRGGATKMRHKFGYSVEQMGEIRYREMLNVRKVLDLSGMTVLDLPDSGLKELDPREIERVVADEIEKVKPSVIVTYPVHGISGFHDHIVGHAAVKRVFTELRGKKNGLKRLAFITVPEGVENKGNLPLNHSKLDEIDCIVSVEDQDLEKFHRALDCYETYREVIASSKIREEVGKKTYFEIFQERYNPPLEALTQGL